MREEFLGLMRCPYCGSDFEVERVYEKKEGHLIDACVRCKCSSYPVVDGILYLKATPVKEILLELIAFRRTHKAKQLLLAKGAENIYEFASLLKPSPSRHSLIQSAIYALMDVWIKRSSRKYFQKNLPLYDLLGSNVYSKYRFSLASLWSVYPFLPLLKEKKDRILDLFCGMGHISHVISTYVKPKELVCADFCFRTLYLARKYFARTAVFVCLDGNYPLPFKDDIFNAVCVVDALFCITGRLLLANEMKRILSLNGLILLLHVHNSLVYNMDAGMALPPDAWIDLLEDNNFSFKAIPEKALIENFILNDEVDLTHQFSTAELNSSKAISLVGTTDKKAFRKFKKVKGLLLEGKNRLAINPIYDVRLDGGKIVLERLKMNPSEIDCLLAEEYLPEKIVIEEKIAQYVEGRMINIESMPHECMQEIERLMSRFVLVDIPEDYRRK